MSNVLVDPSDVPTALIDGAVGVMPTDTVYGLVARAQDPTAALRLYSLKSRENKPGTLIAANIQQLVDLGIKKKYLSAVEGFWPGKISVIVPCSRLEYLHLGTGSLAVRIPSAKWLSDILKNTGVLLTSSANLPGEAPAESAIEAQKVFADKVDFYMNGPNSTPSLPSTIIRVIDDMVVVVRQGAVKIGDNGEIL